MLSLIAVIGKNRELGKGNKLLWYIPGDLPRFRGITTGHPIIMGRKTFQSIGYALPDRTNIVITRDGGFGAEGIVVVGSLEEAMTIAKQSPGNKEIFIIGGGSIFAQSISRADRLYVTVVDMEAPDADTFFPDYARFSHVVSQEPQEDQDYKSVFYILEPESHSSTAPTK